jgi:hypothetical protein
MRRREIKRKREQRRKRVRKSEGEIERDNLFGPA